MNLENRLHGYEFTVLENENIFCFDNIEFVLDKSKENRGIVKYKSKKDGTFYLYPSMWKKPVRNEIFAVKNGTLPPENQYVEVTVQETENIVFSGHFPKNTRDLQVQKVKYITGWKLRNSNELRMNPLTTPEMFLDHMAMPFSGKVGDYERTIQGITSYLISCPQLLDFEKGGISALFFGNKKILDRSKVLNIFTSVLAPELKSSRSPCFYVTLQSDEAVNPINSIEVNSAYLNSKTIPIHLPVYFDAELKNKSSYLPDFKQYTPMLTAFILDGLNFQPEIPDTLHKSVEDKVQDIFETVTSHDTLPYHQNIGSVLSKVGSGLARFNHEPAVKEEHLEKGTELIEESFKDAVNYMKYGYHIDVLYNLDKNSNKLLKLITEMADTGLPLLVSEVQKRSNMSDWNFYEALQKLSDAFYIYSPKKNTIKLMEQ